MANEIDTPLMVDYATFVHDMASGKLESVDVYDYGDVDITYTTQDGSFKAASGPIGLDQDDLLLHVLDRESVPYTVHAEEYGHTDSIWSPSSPYMLTSLPMFLVPLIMIIVILKQSRTISRLSERLADLAKGRMEEDSGGRRPST